MPRPPETPSAASPPSAAASGRTRPAGDRWFRVAAVLVVLCGVILLTAWPRDRAAVPSAGSSAVPSASPVPTPAATPLPPGTAVGRPYSADSAWNTPIAEDARIDSRSDELVRSIGEGRSGAAITSDPTQYTYPVYEVVADAPRHEVPCRWFRCTIAEETGARRVESLADVPIPDGARPSRGSDGSMIVIDVASGAEYDLWQAEERGGSWSVANGSVYNVGWDGMPTEYGSRGAGLPYLAGLIRHWEVASGAIEHAVAFAYPNVAADRCVWPASKTDGQSREPNAIPEGARLQLDPSLTEADFEEMGLDETGRIIARALQRYGMIVVDVSGRPKIMVEDLSANPFATGSWEAEETLLTDATISTIPVDAFRVLALPEAYRSGSASGPRHGDCYA